MKLYSILGVQRDADPETIKRAYRQIAMESHPDRNPKNADAAARFRDAAEAYYTLSDTERRAVYDRNSRQPMSLMDLLQQPLGRKLVAAMLPTAPAAPVDGLDIVTTVIVSLHTITHGGLIEVTNPLDPLSAIPLRVEPGYSWCCLSGMGEPNRNGGVDGDLYIHLLSPTA